MDSEVIVIGGGVGGLSVAYYLVRLGVPVILLEQGDRLGGLATYFRCGDHYIDRFYHCIMPTDASLLRLIHGVGLEGQLYWKPTRMGFIFDGIRYPFNSPLDLLRFRPISLMQRLRFGVVSLLLRRLGGKKRLDNIRTDEWLRQLYGEVVWERVWKPLFSMKFGTEAGSLPARYLWQRLGRERNVSNRGYLRCGLKGLMDALELHIRNSGGIIRKCAPAQTIREADRGMQVRLQSGEVLKGNWVISTVPLPVLRKFTQGSSLQGKFKDQKLPYCGVINTLLFLSRPLEGLYWTPIVNSDTEFDGIIEMSALVDTTQYGGLHLAYLVKYCGWDSELFRENEEAIAQRWCLEFMKLYRDLPIRPNDIVKKHVFKAPFVEPVYPLGYGSRKPDFQVGNAHLLLATSAQIYPQITSMNSTARLAKEAVAYYGRQAGIDCRRIL